MKGDRAKWFGSCKRNADTHCDAISHTKNPQKPKPTCQHCKKPGPYQNQCGQLKGEIDQAQNNKTSASNNDNNNNGGQTNSTSNNKILNNTNANITGNRNDRKHRPVYPPCETCAKTNHSLEKCFFGANAADRPPSPPRNRRCEAQNQVQQRNVQKKTRCEGSGCSPNFKLEKPRHESACDRPKTKKHENLHQFQSVWQQPPETSINHCNQNNFRNKSTIQYTQKTQMTTVASQTSSSKGIEPQNHVKAMKQPPRSQTGSDPLPFLSCSNSCSTDIQESEQRTTTTPTGDTTIPLLTIATLLIEKNWCEMNRPMSGISH